MTRCHPYRVFHAERQVINDQVNDMLSCGIVQPSHSPWASLVVLVKKKDGSIRFCVEYYKANILEMVVKCRSLFCITVLCSLISELWQRTQDAM